MSESQTYAEITNSAIGFLQIEKSILLDAIVKEEINGNLKETLLNVLIPPKLLKKIDFPPKTKLSEKEIIKNCLKVAASDTKIGKIFRYSIDRDEAAARLIEQDAMTRIKLRIEKRKYDDSYVDAKQRNSEIIELETFIPKVYHDLIKKMPGTEPAKIKQAIGYYFNSIGFSRMELQGTIPGLTLANMNYTITKGRYHYNAGNPAFVEICNIIKNKWENRNLNRERKDGK